MPRLELEADFPPVVVARRPMSENRTANWRTQRPVIDLGKCTGCLLCWKFCPEACVSLADGKPVIGLDWCKGCGICVRECPPRCIAFAEEPLA